MRYWLSSGYLRVSRYERRISDAVLWYGDTNETGSSCALIETGIGSFSIIVDHRSFAIRDVVLFAADVLDVSLSVRRYKIRYLSYRYLSSTIPSQTNPKNRASFLRVFQNYAARITEEWKFAPFPHPPSPPLGRGVSRCDRQNANTSRVQTRAFKTLVAAGWLPAPSTRGSMQAD